MLLVQTFTVLTSLFSWELDGLTASLLGTGVVLAGRFALDLVVSFKYRAGGSFLTKAEALAEGEEAGPLVVVEDLEKKPKMLCCLPVETVADFLIEDVALAGVRAVVDFSPMLSSVVNSQGQWSMIQDGTQQVDDGRTKLLGVEAHNHFKGTREREQQGSKSRPVAPSKNPILIGSGSQLIRRPTFRVRGPQNFRLDCVIVLIQKLADVFRGFTVNSTLAQP